MRAHSGPDLTRYTGYLLRRAYVRTAARARECISDDTALREVATLAILADRGPVSQRELADLMGVNTSVMVKLVDTLESKHWVVRGRNRTDRRSYALGLTTSGGESLREFQRDLDRGESAVTAQLRDPERARLMELLRTLLVDDAAASVESLAERSSYLIARAHRLLRERAVDALRPLDVDPRGFGVLATLAEQQPCSQQRLATALGVSAPAVLTFVDELEAAGWVARSRNPEDRRAYDLTLTDAGVARLRAARDAVAAVESRVRATLGPSGDNDLRRLLAKVVGADQGT